MPAAQGVGREPLPQLTERVLAAWDAFLEIADTVDLAAPSRLKGWSGADVCTHLGKWSPPGGPLGGLVENARAGAPGVPPRAESASERLLAEHRGASREQVLAALVDARDAVEDFLDGPDAAEVGLLPAMSAVGALPVLNLVHAGCYELAVHALDLTGAAVPDALQRAGLGALLDTTGGIAARRGMTVSVTAQSPAGGWLVSTADSGWSCTAVDPGPVDGCAVLGSAADLLDVSAGRQQVPVLLARRRLVVQDLPAFLQLAPIVEGTPGIPGGAALRVAARGLGGVGAVLGRFRR